MSVFIHVYMHTYTCSVPVSVASSESEWNIKYVFHKVIV
jgi:hypothetical protein